MTMFVQLLVFTYACALGAADELPDYKAIYDVILIAGRTIHDNVISMDGNVPLLNDPRRHYAEIIHVVHSEAKNEDSCLGHDYYEDYQPNINQAAPFAIANPQSVVDGTNKVIGDIIDGTKELLQLLNASAHADNKAIDEEITNNTEKYGSSIEVFLATERVARLLIQNHEDYFEPISENLSAHNFVVTGAEKLETLVMALKDLYQVLYRPFSSVAC